MPKLRLGTNIRKKKKIFTENIQADISKSCGPKAGELFLAYGWCFIPTYLSIFSWFWVPKKGKTNPMNKSRQWMCTKTQNAEWIVLPFAKMGTRNTSGIWGQTPFMVFLEFLGIDAFRAWKGPPPNQQWMPLWVPSGGQKFLLSPRFPDATYNPS